MTETTTHIYFVLDRSGSMEAIADDVIGGFNTFLDEQAADGPDAAMTLIQFDTGNPFEILAEAAPVREMIRLDRDSWHCCVGGSAGVLGRVAA